MSDGKTTKPPFTIEDAVRAETALHESKANVEAIRKKAAVEERVFDVTEEICPEEVWVEFAISYGRILELQALMAAGVHTEKHIDPRDPGNILAPFMGALSRRTMELRDSLAMAVCLLALKAGRADIAMAIKGGAALGMDFKMRTIEYHTHDQFREAVAEITNGDKNG